MPISKYSKFNFICQCNHCIVNIKTIDTGNDSDFGPYDNNIRRAGTFLISDFPIKRILLVQSYNGKWGPPKGKIEDNETSLDCAVRETMEETGIEVRHLLKECKTFNNKWDIYNVNFNTCPKFNPESSEITGIGWFTYECININKRVLNHPAKLAIREFTSLKL